MSLLINRTKLLNWLKGLTRRPENSGTYKHIYHWKLKAQRAIVTVPVPFYSYVFEVRVGGIKYFCTTVSLNGNVNKVLEYAIENHTFIIEKAWHQ
jgi:hypothetical protein